MKVSENLMTRGLVGMLMPPATHNGECPCCGFHRALVATVTDGRGRPQCVCLQCASGLQCDKCMVMGRFKAFRAK